MFLPLWEEDEQLEEGFSYCMYTLWGVGGFDCDLDHHCMECNETDDSTVTWYVRHKLTPSHKMLAKHKPKELKLYDILDVIDDPAPNKDVSSDAPLSVELPLPVDSPSVTDIDVDLHFGEKLSAMQASFFLQFSSMFSDYSEQLESKFSNTDDRFNNLRNSQLSSTSQGNLNVSQDVSNASFSASTSVAVLTGYTLAKGFYAPQQGGLEIPLGRGWLQKTHLLVVLPFRVLSLGY